MPDWTGLPGSELVLRGIEDLRSGRGSIEALLVSIGAPRLRSAGLEVPPERPDADHALYLLLVRESGDDAHARYNAFLRRLVSFERALECATS